MSETETKDVAVSVSATGGDHRTHAFGFAQQTLDNAEFNETVESLVEGGEEQKQSALTMLFALQDVYGDNMTEFPVPDSDKGNNPDKYEVRVVDTGTGTSKMVKANFYTDYFAATKDGKAWLDIIENIKLAAKPETVKDCKMKMYAEQSGNTIFLQNEKRKYEQRMSSGRGFIKRAVKLYYKLAELSEYPGRIDYDYAKDGKGEIMSTPYPVVLVDKTRALMAKGLSVSQVLKLDVPTAVKNAGEKGNLYDALLATLAREGKTEGSEAKAGAPAIQSPQQLVDYLNEIRAYLDYDMPNGQEHHDLLRTFLDKKGADQALLDLRKSIMELGVAFAPYKVRADRLYEGLMVHPTTGDKHAAANIKGGVKAA